MVLPNTNHLSNLLPNLIAGPYVPPPLKRGDRATCLFRDCEVVVTSWTDAPIPWPRCRSVGSTGGSGLLVSEELARAVRTESALAIRHWFGASHTAVYNWRQALGVTQWGTEGSRRLHEQLIRKAHASLRGRTASADEVRRRIATRKERGTRYGRHPSDWTPEEVALLGTMPDAELAAKLGRTTGGVRLRPDQAWNRVG